MKKILIVSATSNSNYKLAKEIKDLIIDENIKAKIISLEDYRLPLFTANDSTLSEKSHIDTVKELTGHFIESNGVIICGPEYNGSIAPIITNTITWISTPTDYWRDAFSHKIGLIATSSGGGGSKFLLSMKIQLEHLGMVILPRSISINNSAPLKIDSTQKILKQFINLI